MKQLTRFLLLGLLCVSISCSSQPNRETELILKETKTEIKTYIDSANHYFDLVIMEHNQGISHSEIEKKYGRKIEQLETNIDQALEKPNQLGMEGKLTQREYEKWMEDIDISTLMEKHQKIASWGIDFEKLNSSKNHELDQIYTDTINNFSISFPENWSLHTDFQDFTLMGSGPIQIDSSGQIVKQGGFGLDISKLDQNYSPLEYYHANLSSIREFYSDFKIMEEKSIEINGIEANYVAHKCKVNGSYVTSIQVYFTHEGKGYVLNGTSESENFEKYRDLYIEIAQTFEIIEE